MSGLSLETCLSNLKSVALIVLELLAFNSHFKLVWLTGPLRIHRQKHRHTSNEHIISAIHFVHMAEIINNFATRLKGYFPATRNAAQTLQANQTRKPSCRWQTRATLAKSLHGLRKSSGVVSCIASLPIDSVPMVYYYVLYIVTVSIKCVALEILAF